MNELIRAALRAIRGGRLFILAMVLVLAGCSDPAGESREGVTLTLAAGGAPAEVSAWRDLLDSWQRDNPGVTVRLHRLPASSDLQLQAHTTALGSGKAPYDLMRLDIVWLASFAARGWLEPLDRDFDAPSLAPFGALVDRVDRIGGELVALPWNVDMGLLYYRKDLLKKYWDDRAPATWNELAEAAERVRAQAGDPALEGFAWQGKAYEGLTCSFVEHYASSGGDMAAVEKTMAWQREPALAALDRMRALLDQGLSPANTATEMTEEPARLLFMQGRAVFMRNWPYAISLLQAEGSPVAGKVGVAPLPGEEPGKGAATLGGWHLALRAGTPHREQAAALLRYLVSAPAQLELAKRLGWNPSRRDIYEALEKGPGGERYAAVGRALSRAVSRPRVKDYARFSEKTYQAVNAVLLGQISPAEGARRLARP